VFEPRGIGARRVAVAPWQDCRDAAQRRKDVLDAAFRGGERGVDVTGDRVRRARRRFQGDIRLLRQDREDVLQLAAERVGVLLRRS
jgi:hypothetical protein